MLTWGWGSLHGGMGTLPSLFSKRGNMDSPEYGSTENEEETFDVYRIEMVEAGMSHAIRLVWVATFASQIVADNFCDTWRGRAISAGE